MYLNFWCIDENYLEMTLFEYVTEFALFLIIVQGRQIWMSRKHSWVPLEKPQGLIN